MVKSTGFARGISINRIITPKIIREMIRQSDLIHFVRSGVHGVIGPCAEIIEEECRDARPKEIRIVLPSIFNKDVAVRAREAGRYPEEVLTRLHDWLETLAKLSEKLAPDHLLDLRTTMEPHRYHAIFSETCGILGVPWHRKASLTTASFVIGEGASSALSDLHEDFNEFFSQCTPYHLGDNARLREKMGNRVIEEDALLSFGRALPAVLETLRYIASAFPISDGSGATKDHLHAKFHIDKSDCNKRLLDMEDAGLLKRVGDRSAHDHRTGRVATLWGKSMAEKYKDYRADRSR